MRGIVVHGPVPRGGRPGASHAAEEVVMAESYPPTPTSADQAREAARKRIAAKRALTSQVVVYLVVNAFLVGIWFFTGKGYFWPGWVIGGWGIGLVVQAWDVYGRKPISESDIEAEMRRSA
jgi:protein-S-isoprenylcysteine O-methyltransferase Ste14